MKQKTTIEYAQFAEYDRRQSAIQMHVVLSFLTGLAVGALGIALSTFHAGLLDAVYAPYAYLAMAVGVGATAKGLGWALLSTFLSGTSMLVAAMGGRAMLGEFDFAIFDDGGVTAMNLMLAQIAVVGLLSYVIRRRVTVKSGDPGGVVDSL